MTRTTSTLVCCSALAAALIGCVDEHERLSEDPFYIGDQNSTNFPGPNAARKSVAKLDFSGGGLCSGTVVKRGKNLHVVTAGHCGLPTKAAPARAWLTNARNPAGAMAYLNLIDGKRSMPQDEKDIDVTCNGDNPVTYNAAAGTGTSNPNIANAAAATPALIRTCFNNFLNGAEAQLSAVKSYSLKVHIKAANGAVLTPARRETINKAAVARWGDYEVLYPPDNTVCVPAGAAFVPNDAGTLATTEWAGTGDVTLTGRRSVSFPRWDEYKAYRIAFFGETDAQATAAADAAFLAVWGAGWAPVKANLRIELFNQTTDMCRGQGVDQLVPVDPDGCRPRSLIAEQINEKAFGGFTKNRGSAETSQVLISGGDSGGGGFVGGALTTVNSYGRDPLTVNVGGIVGVGLVWEGLIADLERGGVNQKDWGLPAGGVDIDTELGVRRPDGSFMPDSGDRRLIEADAPELPIETTIEEGCGPDYTCMRMNDLGELEPCPTLPPVEDPPVEDPPTEEPPVEEPPTEEPPTEEPPTEDPPTEEPPTEEPTVEEPPAEEPPAEEPPAEEPPAEEPPVEEPSIDHTPIKLPLPGLG